MWLTQQSVKVYGYKGGNKDLVLCVWTQKNIQVILLIKEQHAFI